MSTNLDIILYLLIFTCLVFSALLSGSETAITSLPREKIHQLDESKKNKRIKRAKDQIEKTIGGILVANNFVNILMASLATILFVRRFGERTGGIYATLFITILVLIFGEVTPKTGVKMIKHKAFTDHSITMGYVGGQEGDNQINGLCVPLLSHYKTSPSWRLNYSLTDPDWQYNNWDYNWGDKIYVQYNLYSKLANLMNFLTNLSNFQLLFSIVAQF